MLANLRALFGVIVDIILLRRGPEQLPASTQLLAIVIALNFVVYAIVYQAMPAPILPADSRAWPLDVGFGALLTLLWFRVAFKLAKKPERFVQTMIAVFATNTVFLPVELPMFSALLPYLNKPTPGAPMLLVFAMCVIGIWSLIVLLRIVRLAFEWSWMRSIVFLFAGNIAIALFLSILLGGFQRSA